MQSKIEQKIDDNIINSLLQSSELKSIVKKLVQHEISNKGSHESVIERLSDLFSTSGFGEGFKVTASKHSSTIPINDLRSDKLNYGEEDVSKRCALASLFRLIDMEGWAKSIYNIVSFRSNDSVNDYYINPFGLLYHEITASSLIKIDIDGTVKDSGSTILGINHTNWSIHKAIYNSRDDVKCIVQVSLPDVVAISSIKSGLLPVSVEAVKLLDVSQKSFSSGGVKYHSLIFDKNGDYDQLIKDLEHSKVLFLRNYCLIVCAASIAEAWTLTKTVVIACQAQVRLIQLGGRDLLNSESNFTKMNTLFSDVKFERHHSTEIDINLEAELEFEAMMRLLDNAGYRTGHLYTHRQLCTNLDNTQTSLKFESIASSDENINHITKMKKCANGDIHDGNDEKKDISIHENKWPLNDNECDTVDHTIHNSEEKDDEDREIYEQRIVNEICAEVIDNSIRICENEGKSNISNEEE